MVIQTKKPDDSYPCVNLRCTASGSIVSIVYLLGEVLEEAFPLQAELSGQEVKARFKIISDRCVSDLQRAAEAAGGKNYLVLAQQLLANFIEAVMAKELDGIDSDERYLVESFGIMKLDEEAIKELFPNEGDMTNF